MLYSLYKKAWNLALPLLRRHKRLQDGYTERVLQENTYSKASIWIYSASGGEARVVKTILKALPRDTAFSFVLTTWTKQGYEILKSVQSWVQECCPLWKCEVHYAPFDTEKLLIQCLERMQPRCIVLIETELWPTLLHLAKAYDIPLYIVNARINKGTYTQYKRFPSLMGSIIPAGIFPITQHDAERFADLFPNTPIQCMDNIKFASLFPQPLCTKNKGIVLFASMRKGEVSFCVETVKRIIQKIPTATLWIVPRHLHHAKRLLHTLQKQGIPTHYHTIQPEDTRAVQRFFDTEGTETPSTQQPWGDVFCAGVHVWEAFGLLGSLYRQASVVMVGGTTQQRYGGQNFLEPLSYGIIPIIGKHVENFTWAFDGLEERNLIQIISTAEDCATCIMRKLEEITKQHSISGEEAMLIQERFYQHIAQKLSGTDTVRKILLQYKDEL